MADILMKWLELFPGSGYIGIMLGLMIEIIPSELVLGYAGYLVSQGNLSFAGAVAAGTAGGTFAQLFIYWAAYYGGRPFLLKYGGYIFISRNHIVKAEQWFDKYGAGVIFTARFIPVVRHAISIPAGIAKVSLPRFILYTVAAVIPWTIFFIAVGRALGSRWQLAGEAARPYLVPAAAILVLSAVLIALKKRTPPVITVSRQEFMNKLDRK